MYIIEILAMQWDIPVNEKIEVKKEFSSLEEAIEMADKLNELLYHGGINVYTVNEDWEVENVYVLKKNH